MHQMSKRLEKIFIEKGLSAAIEYALRGATPGQRIIAMKFGLGEMEHTARLEQQHARKKARDAMRGSVTPRWTPRDEAAARAQQEAHAQRLAELDRRAEEARREREAQRELSCRMIDLGFKALAKELHPDLGGDHQSMSRLNRARDHQRRMA
jgi:hypothetical protein